MATMKTDEFITESVRYANSFGRCQHVGEVMSKRSNNHKDAEEHRYNMLQCLTDNDDNTASWLRHCQDYHVVEFWLQNIYAGFLEKTIAWSLGNKNSTVW